MNTYLSVNLEGLELHKLSMAAMSHIDGTKLDPITGNPSEIKIEATALREWNNIAGTNVKNGLSELIKKKVNDYIKLCMTIVYLEEFIGYTNPTISLSSWSQGMTEKIDAILSVEDNKYGISLMSDNGGFLETISKKMARGNPDWIVFFQKSYMSALRESLISRTGGYTGEYDIKSLVRHLRTIGLHYRIHTIALDTGTQALPQALHQRLLQPKIGDNIEKAINM